MAQTVKNLPAMHMTLVRSLGQEDPSERKWQPTPRFLPGEFHGQRILVGYSLWGHKELHTTGWLTRKNIYEKYRSYKLSPVKDMGRPAL